MFSNFRFDPDMLKYLDLIAKKAEEEKIPILFWSPAEHPMWVSIIREAMQKSNWDSMIRRRTDPSLYLNLNEPGRLKCDWFADPVHMDIRCFPEIAIRCLGEYEKKAAR